MESIYNLQVKREKLKTWSKYMLTPRVQVINFSGKNKDAPIIGAFI